VKEQTSIQRPLGITTKNPELTVWCILVPHFNSTLLFEWFRLKYEIGYGSNTFINDGKISMRYAIARYNGARSLIELN